MSQPTSTKAAETPTDQVHWDLTIRPSSGWFELHLRDVWRYRDLLWLFVRRDFVAVYKQTILGPLWFFIQPLLTTLMFTVVFSGIAKVPTEGLPPLLFYLAGTTPWNYFAACLLKTSTTFKDNANLFGKVYFPRLVAPMSIVISTLIQFVIQLLTFALAIGWYLHQGETLQPQWWVLPIGAPLLLLMLGALGLGTGLIVSSLTTKYRDLAFLVQFAVQLAMYATPVVYPLSAVPSKYRFWIELNPMTGIIETFRWLHLGTGSFNGQALGWSAGCTLVILLFGVMIFSRIEKSFMDHI